MFGVCARADGSMTKPLGMFLSSLSSTMDPQEMVCHMSALPWIFSCPLPPPSMARESSLPVPRLVPQCRFMGSPRVSMSAYTLISTSALLALLLLGMDLVDSPSAWLCHHLPNSNLNCVAVPLDLAESHLGPLAGLCHRGRGKFPGPCMWLGLFLSCKLALRQAKGIWFALF